MATRRVTMTGGGPWGFRIFGGADEPLVIAKIRKRSKATEAGLQEGDILLGVNSYSCRGLSHPTVMTLVEQASSELSFDVIRGASDKASVEQALAMLESQLQTLPLEQHQYQAPQPMPIQADASYHSNTVVTSNPNSQVTTETSVQHLGGSSILTKVRREEVVHAGHGPSLSPYPGQEQRGHGPSLSPYPGQEQRGTSPATQPMFRVQQASTVPKPGVWQPGGGQQKPAVKSFKVEAPVGVDIEHHPDQSVTMTLGLDPGSQREVAPAPWENQENVEPSPAPKQYQPPPPVFNVRKITPGAPPDQTWQPANSLPLVHRQPQPPQPALGHYEQQAQPQNNYYHEENSYSGLPLYAGDMRDSGSDMRDDEHEMLRKVMYSHIVMEGGSESESGTDSPTAWFRSKRRIYADSTFYDDPDHKYPTIEEQIKMARKVALSLESPANRKARGHKMFVKRKIKAENWTTEFPGQSMPKSGIPVQDELEEKYYNPNPWHGTHTWSPPSRSLSPSKPPPSHTPQFSPAPTTPYIPPAPPVPTAWNSQPSPRYMAPKPSGEKRSLSAEEFERMRLHGQKSHHNTMPPSVAFSLAEDLRQRKGKGGKMFAKRQERSEKWVVGEGDQGVPNPSVMNKILVQSAMESSDPGRPGHIRAAHSRSPSAPTPSTDYTDAPRGGGGGGGGGMPVNRLKAMIDPPKPACTPWDAVAEDGRLDKAFVHLDGYMAHKRGGYKQAISKNLEKAAERSYMTPYRPKAAGIPVNASRDGSPPRTKPWQAPQAVDHTSIDGGFRNPAPSGPSAPPPQMSNKQGKTFRPIKFKAPSSGPGVFDAGPPVWKNPGDSGMRSEGVSDL